MLEQKLIGKIAATPEILGAKLSHLDIDIDALKADANGYIYTHYNVHIESKLEIVQNTEAQVHLSLPYYDGLEQAAESLGDQDLENVDGGLMVILIVGLIFVGIGTVVSVGAAASAIAVSEVRKKNGEK